MAMVETFSELFVRNYREAEHLIGENGLLKDLTKRLLERAMQAEMKEHLGYFKYASSGNDTGNSRNGSYGKKVRGEFGVFTVAVPRDRNASFEPLILPKRESCFSGYAETIVGMYARGVSCHDVRKNLEAMYRGGCSAALVLRVAEAVTDEIRLWQNRPLDAFYSSMFLDAVRVKARQNDRSVNKIVYLVNAVTFEGYKEVLDIWNAEDESVEFWLQVVTELRRRGVKNIFMACVDGFAGLPEAIHTVFPKTKLHYFHQQTEAV